MGPLDINADELQHIQNSAQGNPRKPDNIKWSDWEKLSEKDKNDVWAEEGLNTFLKNQEIRRKAVEQAAQFKITAAPLEGQSPDNNTQRWPVDQIQKTTDYVFFQFGKYIPPFGKDAAKGLNFRGTKDPDDNTKTIEGSVSTKRSGYNASISKMEVDGDYPTIMLPIPQDLSNTTAAGWQGKAFTGMGRAAIAAVAGGNNAFALQKAGDFSGNIKALQDSLTSNVLNLVPGVGGNLDVNDISGSARGVVLNPNAELLYDSPELREIGMSFKMVPRNAEEAAIIRTICQTFRKAALPTWGAAGKDDFTFNEKVTYATSGDAQGATARGKEGGDGSISGENFLRVPHLCKFTFMKGNKPHQWLAQYKPCAISNVVVNYTPDNTYATYSDGSPVATEIRLNFQETKLIFSDEVEQGF
tara:strand:+ start:212 stop:1453 length:1242 start_codon:yes stop_codon:yes gene_type:complete